MVLRAPTRQEVLLANESWVKVMEDPQKSAIIVFTMFLEKYPKHLTLFKSLQGVAPEEYPNNAFFKKHSLGIVMKLDQIIQQAVKSDKDLCPNLHDLGKTHSKRGVLPPGFDDVQQTLLDFLIQYFNIEGDAVKAWDIVLGYAFSFAKIGNEEGLK